MENVILGKLKLKNLIKDVDQNQILSWILLNLWNDILAVSVIYGMLKIYVIAYLPPQKICTYAVFGNSIYRNTAGKL